MFLKDFEPANPPQAGGDNSTSFEIAEALGDICSIPPNDVAAVMLYSGYTLYRNNIGGFEWSMRYVGENREES